MATKRIIAALPPIFNQGRPIPLPATAPIPVEIPFAFRVDEIPEQEIRYVNIEVQWDWNAETFQQMFVRARNLAIAQVETETGTHTVVSN